MDEEGPTLDRRNEVPIRHAIWFRSNRSTTDANFVIQTIISAAHLLKTPLVITFVDFSKAFDTISRQLLWIKLAATGLPPETVRLFKRLYGKVEGQLHYPDGTKSEKSSFKGV